MKVTNFWSMQEEPGGQRALVFDQGNRISQVRVMNCYLFADNCNPTGCNYNHETSNVQFFNHLFPKFNQGISCADVADICVKALHDSTARNKSFDVSKTQICLVSDQV